MVTALWVVNALLVMIIVLLLPRAFKLTVWAYLELKRGRQIQQEFRRRAEIESQVADKYKSQFRRECDQSLRANSEDAPKHHTLEPKDDS